MNEILYKKIPEGQFALLEKFSKRVNGVDADFAVFDVIGEVLLDSPCESACRQQGEMKSFAADVLTQCQRQRRGSLVESFRLYDLA